MDRPWTTDELDREHDELRRELVERARRYLAMCARSPDRALRAEPPEDLAELVQSMRELERIEAGETLKGDRPPIPLTRLRRSA